MSIELRIGSKEFVRSVLITRFLKNRSAWSRKGPHICVSRSASPCQRKLRADSCRRMDAITGQREPDGPPGSPSCAFSLPARRSQRRSGPVEIFFLFGPPVKRGKQTGSEAAPNTDRAVSLDSVGPLGNWWKLSRDLQAATLKRQIFSPPVLVTQTGYRDPVLKFGVVQISSAGLHHRRCLEGTGVAWTSLQLPVSAHLWVWAGLLQKCMEPHKILNFLHGIY